MLTENDVVEAVVVHLSTAGWTILQSRTTAQRGVDILAERNGESLAVEAKGGGSATAGTRRFGQHFTTNQKRSHVAVALLTAVQVLSEGKHRAGLAFPDDDGHSRLVTSILPILRSLDIHVFLVSPDRTVHTATLPTNGHEFQ